MESIQYLSSWGIAAILLFLVFSFIFVNTLRTLIHQRSKLFILLIWLLTPFLISLFVSYAMNANYSVRYVMLAFPSLIILMAIGILEFPKLSHRIIFLGLVGLLSCYSLFNQYFNERYHNENTRAAGKYLTQFVNENDLLLVNAPYMAYDISYYYKGNAKVVGFPWESEVLNDTLRLTIELGALLERKTSKTWLILSRTFHGDKNKVIKTFFDRKYESIETKHWTGVDLFVYDLKIAKKQVSSTNFILDTAKIF